MPRKKHRDNFCFRAIQKFDMYGYEIGFNINGEDVHKTIPGAIISLFIFLLGFCFFS